MSSFEQAVSLTGPVAHWRLSETAGAFAERISGTFPMTVSTPGRVTRGVDSLLTGEVGDDRALRVDNASLAQFGTAYSAAFPNLFQDGSVAWLVARSPESNNLHGWEYSQASGVNGWRILTRGVPGAGQALVEYQQFGIGGISNTIVGAIPGGFDGAAGMVGLEMESIPTGPATVAKQVNLYWNGVQVGSGNFVSGENTGSFAFNGFKWYGTEANGQSVNDEPILWDSAIGAENFAALWAAAQSEVADTPDTVGPSGLTTGGLVWRMRLGA